jgi:hypothetical protein
MIDDLEKANEREKNALMEDHTEFDRTNTKSAEPLLKDNQA